MKLTEEKLRQLMVDLEAENVERTRAFDKADKMGQAICAFANDLADRRIPGYLLLGVENDGRISGRRIDDEHLTSLGGLKTEGNLLPPPAMALDVFHFIEGDVVVITVFPSAYPPIRYQGQVWIRVGARKALATDEDIHILEERSRRSRRSFEERPCLEAKLEDLDLELFRNQYLPKAVQAAVIEGDPRPIQEQMAALRFYDLDAKVPTNLGVLLFGKHPERFIPSAYLQYLKLSSATAGGSVLAEHAYMGPLLRTIPELDSFVKVGVASPHPVRISGFQEKTGYVYPHWAMRELLLNSIIHRDYEISNAPIRFYDYNGTRIEIINPGALYGQANIDNFPTVNDYRNPRLAEAVKVMGYVNKYSLGVLKVKEEMSQNGNPEPEFEVFQRNLFRVIVRPAVEVYDKFGILVENSSNGEINGKINSGINSENGENTKRPESNELSPNGDVLGSSGDVSGPSGDVSGPSGDVSGPSGDVSGPSGVKFKTEHLLVLRTLEEDKGFSELLNSVQRTNRTKFRQKILSPLLAQGYIEPTQPDSPNSPTQKYHLTEKGRAFLEGLKHE